MPLARVSRNLTPAWGYGTFPVGPGTFLIGRASLAVPKGYICHRLRDSGTKPRMPPKSRLQTTAAKAAASTATTTKPQPTPATAPKPTTNKTPNPPPTGSVAEQVIANGLNPPPAIMQALYNLQNVIKKTMEADPQLLKNKDEEIKKLKEECEELKTQLYVKQCEIQEKANSLHAYFRTNKELKDKLEAYTLTHYDRVSPSEVSEKASEIKPISVDLDPMEERMKFDYVPGKRKTPPKTETKQSPPKKKEKKMEEPEPECSQGGAITLDDLGDFFIGDDDNPIFNDELELTSTKKQKQ